jgi:hypothetical protein
MSRFAGFFGSEMAAKIPRRIPETDSIFIRSLVRQGETQKKSPLPLHFFAAIRCHFLRPYGGGRGRAAPPYAGAKGVRESGANPERAERVGGGVGGAGSRACGGRHRTPPRNAYPGPAWKDNPAAAERRRRSPLIMLVVGSAVDPLVNEPATHYCTL